VARPEHCARAPLNEPPIRLFSHSPRNLLHPASLAGPDSDGNVRVFISTLRKIRLPEILSTRTQEFVNEVYRHQPSSRRRGNPLDEAQRTSAAGQYLASRSPVETAGDVAATPGSAPWGRVSTNPFQPS
jgi:hypothetical protein